MLGSPKGFGTTGVEVTPPNGFQYIEGAVSTTWGHRDRAAHLLVTPNNRQGRADARFLHNKGFWGPRHPPFRSKNSTPFVTPLYLGPPPLNIYKAAYIPSKGTSCPKRGDFVSPQRLDYIRVGQNFPPVDTPPPTRAAARGQDRAEYRPLYAPFDIHHDQASYMSLRQLLHRPFVSTITKAVFRPKSYPHSGRRLD